MTPHRVVWLDIQSWQETWAEPEEAKALTPIEMVSHGYILSDTNSHIVLAGTAASDHSCYGDLNAIPRGCILSIEAA
jgi:hypothetical protein